MQFLRTTYEGTYSSHLKMRPRLAKEQVPLYSSFAKKVKIYIKCIAIKISSKKTDLIKDQVCGN
jgi:hypothetical protein